TIGGCPGRTGRVCCGAGSQVAPGGSRSATVTTSSRSTARSRCRGRAGGAVAVRAAGETVREAVTEGREREVAMRDQLFRARNATCVGRDDGRAMSGGPSRTYAVRAGRPGWCALPGRRVRRATTHPVEVVVFPGVPEWLEVTATQREELPVAGYASIEADLARAQ